MSTLVVQERHHRQNLVDMRKTDKNRFLDFSIFQAGLFGDAVENFGTLARQQAAASTLPSQIHPPRAEGNPLRLPLLPHSLSSSFHPDHSVDPVTKRWRSLSRPLPNQAISASTGDPEMEGAALQEMVTAPLPPPEEGRCQFCFCSATGPTAKLSIYQ